MVFGLVAAYAFDDAARPLIDWTKLWVCVVAFAAAFGVFGLVRYGARLAPLSAITGAGVGWVVGAWGGADIGTDSLHRA